MRAIIFDLDGTLCDSAHDIHLTANIMLEGIGKGPLPLETVRSFIGNGIPKLVERVMREVGIEVTDKKHAELSAVFEEIYTAAPAVKTCLYPGVRDALDLLKSRGYVLGVCTNKKHSITLRVLDGLRISAYFGAVVGGDSLPTHKPDPVMLHDCARQLDATEVWYVGDSEVDAETAVAANIKFSLFTGGYRKSPVSEIPHDTRFTTFADLAGFLSAVGEKSVVL